MNKFQVFEATEQFNHAGSKATADIMSVAEALGFKTLFLRMRTTQKGCIAKVRRQIGYIIDWNKCYRAVTEGAVILLQHPFHYPQITREKQLYALKQKKHVNIISIVHDVEELRAFRFNDYYKKEFKVMLEISDVIIVHNEAMRSFFLSRGVPEDKLVVLRIFDYLQRNTEKNIKFEKSISIAGNLDVTKCKYIGQLGEIQEVKINLYGPNFKEDMKKIKNIEYHGSYPVEEIPDQLKGGFGLVWDGDSIDGCVGLSGQYLKYNSPHKLSLYLSSGIPVIIWSGAAEADFVRENGVGICVDSLRDVDKIFAQLSEKDYFDICAKVKNIRCRLISGNYTKSVLEESLLRIKAKCREHQ